MLNNFFITLFSELFMTVSYINTTGTEESIFVDYIHSAGLVIHGVCLHLLFCSTGLDVNEAKYIKTLFSCTAVDWFTGRW